MVDANGHKTLFLNPEYVRKKDDWELLRDLYEGKHDVVCKDSRYLWPHAVEVTKSYTDDKTGDYLLGRRQNRTRYLNWQDIILSLLIAFLFKKPGKANEELKIFLKDEISDIDGEGTSLDTFVKTNIAEPYLNYGKVVCLADALAFEAATEAEAESLGVRSFLKEIHPISFPDWATIGKGPRAGRLKFGRFVYEELNEREDETVEPVLKKKTRSYAFTIKDKKQVVRVRIYEGDEKKNSTSPSGQGSELHDNANEWKVVDEKVLEIAEIPLAVLEDASWLIDVAQENLRYHNTRSSADNIRHNQGYRQTFITGVDPGDDKQVKAINETNFIFLPVNSTVTSLEPVGLADYQSALAESVSNIFKQGLNQSRMLAADSKMTQAADSLIEEKQNTANLAKSVIEDIENYVNYLLALKASYHKNAPQNLKYELNKDFSVEDVDQFIRVYGSLRDLFSKYPDIEPEIVKKGLSTLNLDDDVFERLLKSVDNGAVEPKPENKDDPVGDALATA